MAQSSLNCNVGLKHLFYLCKSILLPFQTEVKRIFQHLSTCPHMIVICYSAQRLMIWISDDPRVKMQLKLEFTASFSNSDRIKTLQTVRAFPHFALLPLLREISPPTKCQQVQSGKIAAYYQQMDKRQFRPGHYSADDTWDSL